MVHSHLPLVSFIYGITLMLAFLIYRWRWKRGDYGHIAISLILLFALFNIIGKHDDTRMGAVIAVLIIEIFLALKTIANRRR